MNALQKHISAGTKTAQLINIIGFQLCWAACVIGGNLWALVCVFLFMLWHWTQRKPGELKLIILLTLTGTLFDSILMHLGVLSFPSHGGVVIPLWLILLWCSFAATLRHSLAWLLQRPLLASVLAAISAPWSYYAGSLFDAVSLTYPALPVIAVAWAVLLGFISVNSRGK